MKIIKSRIKTKFELQNPSKERVTEIEEDYSESSEEENDRLLIKRKDTDDDNGDAYNNQNQNI
jgi:hypothetical protein